MLDLAGVKIERIDIRDSPRAVDDAVGLDDAIFAARFAAISIDDAQAIRRPSRCDPP